MDWLVHIPAAWYSGTVQGLREVTDGIMVHWRLK